MPTKTQRLQQTIGYYAAFVALGMTTASLGPSLPWLAENTRTRLAAISFLFIAYKLGYLLGSLGGGRLYDRLPGHTVLSVVLIVMGSLATVVPLISSLWLLAGIVLVLGTAAGMVEVGGNTLLVWVHGRQVGPFMNGLHFFFGVGALLSPLLIAQAVTLGGDIRWAYWAFAALMLPGIAWLLRLSSPGRHAQSEDKGPIGGHIPAIALTALLLFLYVGAENSYGGWIFTYATAQDMADVEKAAYLTSAFWGALTLGRLLSIPVAARFRPQAILLTDLLGCFLCAGILLLWPHSILAVWLGTLGVGLAMASVFPTVVSLAERRMPITGQVAGWFFAGASAGGMSLPWLIGQMFGPVGPQVLPVLIGIDVIAALSVLGALARRPRQASAATSYPGLASEDHVLEASGERRDAERG